MAKRRLLQWMRERLSAHAEKVVVPAAEKKALDAAYKKALPLILGTLKKKYPPADMEVLKKWGFGCAAKEVRVQFPDGAVDWFDFADEDRPHIAERYSSQIHAIDAPTAAAVQKWLVAAAAYKAERKKRITAYEALIAGSTNVEDITDMWPGAKGVLPLGSPPIPLGPEQIALVKADQRERKAAA